MTSYTIEIGRLLRASKLPLEKSWAAVRAEAWWTRVVEWKPRSPCSSGISGWA